jgi:serine/threonine-protein kinase
MRIRPDAAPDALLPQRTPPGPLTPERRREIDGLLDEALDLPTAERDAWLARRCGDDAALRGEVAALLAAHDAPGGILDGGVRGVARALVEGPSVGGATAPDGPGGVAERRIGVYRVLRELGRGGMGVVYLAERDDGQFRRRVAVKLLRASPDAEELHRRFVAERQILASLQHPNIAQLLDGGVTDGELPYLVMEHVDGVPISEYCDRHRLGVAARLRLFQDVCAAVHHAHQNLVIHRDLKPGNILVTTAGQVKLLDFGIAKLLNPGLSAVELPLTRAEHRVMTPEYASPEQIRGDALTTASDVYALGVVLYELLAGHPPYQLADRTLREQAELICEHDPERPSSRVLRAERLERRDGSTHEVTPAEVAAARDATAERLRRQLRGDLDAIVLTALRKEPGRRYASADRLADDVQRYLDGQPVQARMGTRWYRAAKLLRRHRAASAVAALATFAVLAAAGVALRQAGVAGRERDRAATALQQSEQVTGFLMGLFEAYDPEGSASRLRTARDFLQLGTTRVHELAGQPLLQARLLEVIGRVYRDLGHYTEARAALERSLALRSGVLDTAHLEVVGAMHHLADALRREGRYRDAVALSRRAAAIRERLPAAGEPDLAAMLIQLAGLEIYVSDVPAAERLARRALALREASLSPDDTLVAVAEQYLGSVTRLVGKHDEAERRFRAAIARRERIQGATHPAVAYALIRLADILWEDRGRPEEAEELYRRALPLMRDALGERHPTLLAARSDFALLRAERGAHAEAEAMQRQVLDAQRTAYGPDHPNAIGALGRLGMVLAQAGRHAEAEPLLRQELALWQRTLGPRHGALAPRIGRLADVLIERGRYAEADSILREAVAIADEAAGRESGMRGLMLINVGRLRTRQGDFASADSAYQRALAIFRRDRAETHVDIRRVHAGLAELHAARGRPEEAARHRALSQPPD